MADESQGQEKTEAPTPRRIQEARKKGDVAKSMEVPSAAVLLAGLLTLYLLSDYLLGHFYLVLKHYLGNLATIKVEPNSMFVLTRDSMLLSALLVGPLMGVILIAALASNYAQIGVLFSAEKITPKIEKIDPIKGFANLFSKQTLANVVKSFAKLIIVGWISYSEIEKALPALLPLTDQEPMPIFAFMTKVAFWIFLKSALIIALLAAADYAFQRWQFMEKMKMTKQELKDEAKQTEGDPHVRGRIRAIQMEMARQRMMAEVPTADVIITNPIRLAIALRYDSLAMPAPMVVARGAGVIAQRIREVATENDVPIVENKPLAQALYKTVGLNASIPENLFQPVAEVLAYVYSLKAESNIDQGVEYQQWQKELNPL